MILNKKQLPVKEVQFKLMKEEESKISLLTRHLFSPREIHRNENNFPVEIHNGECHQLSFGSLS